VGGALVLPELAGTLAKAQPQPAPLQHAHPVKDVEGAIMIDANENPYGPSQRARDAITTSENVASRYPDSMDTHMVEAVAKHHNVSPDQVLLGCGSTEILRCADFAFLGSTKNVIAAEPTFEAVLNFAKVMQSNPIKVPLTADHRHDLKAMAQKADAVTGLIYICNPNNPTGTIVTLDELHDFMDHVPLNATVLVDEAYFHFVEDGNYGSVVDWIGKYPNLVVARTFSKVYGMAGMRLGYAVSSQENIRKMSSFILWSNANVAVLEAAIASLNDPDHVREQRNKNIATRRWLYGELDRDGRTYIPSHTNFMMIDVGRDVSPVAQQFAQRKIFVGRKFPSMENWLRVSMGTPGEMLSFMQALREIVPASGAKAA
jgi:histidinol-phosphate aminotransferase